MSTKCAMNTKSPQSTTKSGIRQIIGFSMSPTMATEVKLEAAKRGMTLRKLFEEMWAAYQEGRTQGQ